MYQAMKQLRMKLPRSGCPVCRSSDHRSWRFQICKVCEKKKIWPWKHPVM